MLLLMPIMITVTCSLTFYLWKLRQPVRVVQTWDESSLLCCVWCPWAKSLLQVHRFHGACYKKYNSYEEGIAAFKSRTNSNPALAHDDDFYLQNPIAAPPSSSFKTIIIVVLLIFVCLLWKKLWARVLIVSAMVRLDYWLSSLFPMFPYSWSH